MSYRCLMVVNPARIRCQKEQLQFSVYARVCNGNDAVKKHEGRLRGFPAAERLYTSACRYRKAIPVHSNSFGKLSTGGRSLCL